VTRTHAQADVVAAQAGEVKFLKKQLTAIRTKNPPLWTSLLSPNCQFYQPLVSRQMQLQAIFA
jgi:hypothetical protein